MRSAGYAELSPLPPLRQQDHVGGVRRTRDANGNFAFAFTEPADVSNTAMTAELRGMRARADADSTDFVSTMPARHMKVHFNAEWRSFRLTVRAE